MQWLSAVTVAVALLAMMTGPLGVVDARVLPSRCDEDPRAARLCAALNNFLDLYAAEQAEQAQAEFRAPSRDYPLLDSGVKRQDVVHSFLRFGRRR